MMNHSTPQADQRIIELGSNAWIPQSALRFAFSRAGGPGGQAVNKLSTKAQLRVAVRGIAGLDEQAAARLRHLAGKRLTHDDDILIEAQTHRSQLDNKQACIERLRSLVTAALVRPKLRRKRKPTRTMIEKRLKSKRRTAEKKSLRRARPDE